MTIPKVKFSELYIKYNTVKTQRFLSIDSKTNEPKKFRFYASRKV